MNNSNNRKYALVAVLLLLVAGCHQPPPSWSLTLFGWAVSSHNDHVDFNTTVGLGGHPPEGVQVNDVRVAAFAANGTVLDTAIVGNIRSGARSETDITIHLDERPDRVVPEFSSITNPGSIPCHIEGLQRGNEGYDRIGIERPPACKK